MTQTISTWTNIVEAITDIVIINHDINLNADTDFTTMDLEREDHEFSAMENDSLELTKQLLIGLKRAGFDTDTIPELVLPSIEQTEEMADIEELEPLIKNNPILELLLETLTIMAELCVFYQLFISDIQHQCNDEFYDLETTQIEFELAQLALMKTTSNRQLMPNFEEAKLFTFQNYEKWIFEAKRLAFKYNVNIEVEFSRMLTDSVEQLNTINNKQSFESDNTQAQIINLKEEHFNIYDEEVARYNENNTEMLDKICQILNVSKDDASHTGYIKHIPDSYTRTALLSAQKQQKMLEQIALKLGIQNTETNTTLSASQTHKLLNGV